MQIKYRRYTIALLDLIDTRALTSPKICKTVFTRLSSTALRYEKKKKTRLTQRRWQANRPNRVAEWYSLVQAQQRDVIVEIQEAEVTSHHAHHVSRLRWLLHASVMLPESDLDHEPHESEKKTRRTDHIRLRK